jgi:hypothetical protein
VPPRTITVAEIEQLIKPRRKGKASAVEELIGALGLADIPVSDLTHAALVVFLQGLQKPHRNGTASASKVPVSSAYSTNSDKQDKRQRTGGVSSTLDPTLFDKYQGIVYLLCLVYQLNLHTLIGLCCVVLCCVVVALDNITDAIGMEGIKQLSDDLGITDDNDNFMFIFAWKGNAAKLCEISRVEFSRAFQAIGYVPTLHFSSHHSDGD